MNVQSRSNWNLEQIHWALVCFAFLANIHWAFEGWLPLTEYWTQWNVPWMLMSACECLSVSVNTHWIWLSASECHWVSGECLWVSIKCINDPEETPFAIVYFAMILVELYHVTFGICRRCNSFYWTQKILDTILIHHETFHCTTHLCLPNEVNISYCQYTSTAHTAASFAMV